MQNIQYATSRLVVEHWGHQVVSPDHRLILAEELRSILTAEVLQHLPPSLQLGETDGTVVEWIENRAAESDVLAIRDREARLLGLLILASSSEAPSLMTVHIGYLLSEAAWGHGYATELIAGLVSWYRGTGESIQLYGGVDKKNVGSARVLIKNGFTLDRNASDLETEIYGLLLP